MSEGQRKIDFFKIKNQIMESKSNDILSFENFLNSIAAPQSTEILTHKKTNLEKNIKNQPEDNKVKNSYLFQEKAIHIHDAEYLNPEEQKNPFDDFFKDNQTLKNDFDQDSHHQNLNNNRNLEKKNDDQIGLEDFEDFDQQNNNEEINSPSGIFENDKNSEDYHNSKEKAEFLVQFKSDSPDQEKQLDIQTGNSTEHINECFNIMTEILKTPERKVKNLNEDYEFVLLDSSLKKNIKICQSKYKLKRLSGDLGKFKIPPISKDYAINLASKNQVPRSYLHEENDVMFQKEREKLKFYAKQAFNFKNKKNSNFVTSSFKNIKQNNIQNNMQTYQNKTKDERSPIVTSNRLDSSKKTTPSNLKERKKEFEHFLDDVGLNPSSYLKNNNNADQKKKFGSLNEM